MAEDIVARYRLDLNQLNADVSELKAKFNVVDNAANKSADKASVGFSKLGSTLTKLGGLIGVAFSTKAVIDFGIDCVKSFQQAEKSAKLLQNTISASGGLTADYDKLIQRSNELEKISIFSASSIQGMQTAAIQFGLSSDAVQKLTPIIADFASATNQDMNSALQDVISAVNGSDRALKKYGISIDQSKGKSENLGSITEQLTAKFAGQAKTVGETSAGSVAKLANSWDNLKARIGSALIPIAQAAVDAGNAIARIGETKHSEELIKEKENLLGIRIELLSLNPASKTRIDLIKDLQSKYPEFLKGLNDEKVGNEQLNKAFEKLNNTMVYNIALQQSKEQLTPLYVEEAKAAVAVTKATSKLSIELAKVYEQSKRNSSPSNDAKIKLLESLPILQQASELMNYQIRLSGISSESLVNMANAYDDLIKVTIKWSSASEKAEFEKGNFDKTLENLKKLYHIVEADGTKSIEESIAEILNKLGPIAKASSTAIINTINEIQKKFGSSQIAQGEIARLKEQLETRKDIETKAAKDKYDAMIQAEKDYQQLKKDLAEKELNQDEENVKLEVAKRMEALSQMHLSKEETEKGMTAIELFQLMARLQNFKDYGKDVGDIMVNIAQAHKKMADAMSKPVIIHPNREDFDEFMNKLKEADNAINEYASQQIELFKQIGNEFGSLQGTLNTNNQQSLQQQLEDNSQARDAEEQALKDQFDKRIIGNAEYEKRLKAIKDKRAANEEALNSKMRKIQARQAAFEKLLAVYNIILNYRQAIMAITAKWAAFPIIESGLITNTSILYAVQLAAALAANPPKSHKGEKYVKRKRGENNGIGSDETIRTLQVGERVSSKDVNKKYWNIFESIDNGTFDDLIFTKYITPALKKQQEKHERQLMLVKSTNIANALSSGLDRNDLLKLWSKGIGVNIINMDQFNEIFNSQRQPYRK